MCFYFTDTVGGHLLTFEPYDRWYLTCDYDEMDNACVYLNVYNTECMVCCSTEFTAYHPALDSFSVMEYYASVLEAIGEALDSGDCEYFNIDQIRKAMLPRFWAQWEEEGLVCGEPPI